MQFMIRVMTCPASGQAEFGIVVRQILCCIAAQPSWSTKTMALAEDGTYERCGMKSHSACVIVCMLQCNPRSSGMKVLSVLTSLLARCTLRTSLHYSRDCVAFVGGHGIRMGMVFLPPGRCPPRCTQRCSCHGGKGRLWGHRTRC